MHSIKEKINSFLHDKNPLESTDWINSLQIDITGQKDTLVVYFPHKFLYQWFLRQYKELFENFVFSNSYEIRQIYYHLPKKNNKFTIDSFEYNSKFNLNNFIYNQKNYLAFISAKEFVKEKSKNFNPFLIWGTEGTGKTHLLCSIANSFILDNPNIKISYTTPSNIYNNYKKSNDIYSFEKKLMAFDIFCFDDIHNLTIYDELQTFILNLFNYYIDNGKFFIAAGNNIFFQDYFIDTTLKSRLDSGLNTHLYPPDLDIKLSYISYFCQEKHIALTEQQRIHLANYVEDFKSLQSALYRVLASRELQPEEPLDMEKLLNEHLRSSTRPLTTETILSEICEYFSISREEILSSTKRRDVVRARQIGMALCRQLLNMPYTRIGGIFGNRDHSTVIYSVNQLLRLRRQYPNIDRMWKSMKHRCEQLRLKP